MAIDYLGTVFNKLTIVEKVNYKNRTAYKCLCSCGKMKEKPVTIFDLKAGKVTSCGCVATSKLIERNKKLAKHNKSQNNITYTSWVEMRRRCRDSSRHNSHLYHDKNITVCERWETSFTNFLEDMGERPSKLHTINRKNNNGIYEPGNCNWAIPLEQSNNKSNNVFITDGKLTLTLAQWCRATGLTAYKVKKIVAEKQSLSSYIKHSTETLL